MATPNKYNDKYWDDLASAAGAKAGLPPGLLLSIKNNGEKSNNDQVSSAGARTPFQIIPATRKAILKKYGIDPYLSPENAAEGAALLLKESLDRNKGDIASAVSEYHGGTDRKNWGPVNKAYVGRVVPGMEKINVAKATDDFGAWLAEHPSNVDSQISQVGQLQNRVAGSMAGEKPADAATPPTDNNSPDISAASADFGKFLEAERNKPETAPAPEQGLLRGAWEGLKESVTGAQRATPETQALPDWTMMPEISGSRPLDPAKAEQWGGSFPDLTKNPMGSSRARLGTVLATDPKEIVQIIQSNFPDAKVRQDEKGNFLITSSIDGKEYAIKPGAQPSDIPRIAAGLTAFGPAAGATSALGSAAAMGATQAAIEASQAATGGDFSAKDVGLSALGGAIIPPVVGGVSKLAAGAAPYVKAAAARALGGAAQEAAPATGAMERIVISGLPQDAAKASAQASPTPPAAPVAPPDLAQTAQMATKATEGLTGKAAATKELAAAVAPDKETLASAERLGIKEYLQPDHISTNQAYREIAQAAKSTIGSEGRAIELKGLEEVGKKADDIITKMGGTDDLSSVSQKVKEGLQKTQGELKSKENVLYNSLKKEIGAGERVSAPKTLAFIEQQAKDLNGKANLSPLEKEILAKLGNKPTYALLDEMGRKAGAASRMSSAFSDADTGLAKKLYGLLDADRKVVAESKGVLGSYEEAHAATRLRKGIEDDLKGLFGKNIDGNIVSKLTGSVAALSKGDTKNFVNLVKSVPEDMRQELVASGLNSAFGKTAKQGTLNFNTYAQWYEGLMKNKQAYTAIMSNLPKQSQQNLKDLYNVSSGIARASKERITTGRITDAADMFKSADSLVSKIMDAVKHNAVMTGASTAAHAIHPGLGTVIALALNKGAKTETLRAVDKLLSSPAFKEAVLDAAEGNTKQAAHKLAKNVVFIDFVKKAKLTDLKTLSDRERWVAQALEAQTGNQPQPTTAQGG